MSRASVFCLALESARAVSLCEVVVSSRLMVHGHSLIEFNGDRLALDIQLDTLRCAFNPPFQGSLQPAANQNRDPIERYAGSRPAGDRGDPLRLFAAAARRALRSPRAADYRRHARRRSGPLISRHAPGSRARSRLRKNLSADSYPTTRSTSLPLRSKKMIPGGPNRLKRLSNV